MDSSDVPVKSSNEILTELFGVFNAEPPKMEIKSKRERSSSGEPERKSKKSKKSKSKKSKKKHKSKSKKHKRKHSESDSDSSSEDSDSGSNSESSKLKKKKRKKDKKHKKYKSSPVNIELPVNKVPMALEIMLDGTVGIKGDDGVITKIPDVSESEKHVSDWEDDSGKDNNALPTSTTNDKENNFDDDVKKSKEDSKSKTAEVKSVSNSIIPEVFEADSTEQAEKQKKGKIQIRDLKFSSVFQETVKAVEEKQKKEQEKKANYEDGELSDSSTSDKNSEIDGTRIEDKDRKHDRKHHRHRSRSRSRHYKEGDLRHYLKKKERSRSRSKDRHDSRRHSPDRSSYYYYRSRSRDYPRSSYYGRDVRRYSPSRSRSHHSSSRTRENRRSHSRSQRSRSKDRKAKSRSSHRSNSREDKHSRKSKSKERSDSVEKIDKEKLLAIARKNALKLIDAGVVPGAEKLTTIKAGGKTVNELTEYCKKLSKKEALGAEVSDIESESSDEGEKPFHHPFQVRDRPNSIIMNIKNATPLPVKSLQEKAAEQSKQLRLQFPVSSGSSHRRTESEWVPVSPKKEEVAQKQVAVIKPPPPLPVEPPLPVQAPVPVPQPVELSAVPPPEPFNKPVFPVIQPGPAAPKLDISSIVSKRLEAMRKLQENPNDSQALTQMYHAQKEMQFWAESKQETGAFTGSTGAKVLSPAELSSGAQAWAKRDQLTSATPVKGGMGMALLQKMGWQPGEGLGKNKEGTLEPLKLEVKMDKKGLLAADESRKGGKKGPLVQQGPVLPTVKTLDGKHPVSLLNEYCTRRRYGVPQFELCFECGPDHKKNFLFKVIVNGKEYTPSVASPNKKQAKAEAAAICLRALGLISGDASS